MFHILKLLIMILDINENYSSLFTEFSVGTKKPPGWLGPVEKEYYSRAE